MVSERRCFRGRGKERRANRAEAAGWNPPKWMRLFALPETAAGRVFLYDRDTGKIAATYWIDKGTLQHGEEAVRGLHYLTACHLLAKRLGRNRLAPPDG